MDSLLTPQEIEDFNDADYKTWGEFKRALATAQDAKTKRKLVEWLKERHTNIFYTATIDEIEQALKEEVKT